MGNIIKAIGEYWNGSDLLAALFFISIFIEFAPIKINPIQWCTNLFYKGIVDKLSVKIDEVKSEATEKIGETSHKIDEIKEETNVIKNDMRIFEHRIDMIEINNMRTSILTFANSCMRREKHTHEEFTHIFALCDRYENVIENSGIVNGQMKVSIEFIRNIYKECLRDGSFLSGDED